MGGKYDVEPPAPVRYPGEVRKRRTSKAIPGQAMGGCSGPSHLKQAFGKIGAVCGPGTTVSGHRNAAVKGKHIGADAAAGIQHRNTGWDVEHPSVHRIVTKTIPSHLVQVKGAPGTAGRY